jgi:phosphatidate phosphatase APP1
VLIGDSGEQDPEIYREVQSRFGTQVQEIVIRDLTNARQLTPARLTGMTVVAAPTVVHGVSQLAH